MRSLSLEGVSFISGQNRQEDGGLGVITKYYDTFK